MSKSGTISLKKSAKEGRRIFKNKNDGVYIVFEKWVAGNIWVIFIKDNKIIDIPKGYMFQYSYGDKTKDQTKG
ncbi:17187_t:CDS:1, partial [Dentiscutata erythropus]